VASLQFLKPAVRKLSSLGVHLLVLAPGRRKHPQKHDIAVLVVAETESEAIKLIMSGVSK